MKDPKKCLKRYVVEARRKSRNQKWSEWSRVDTVEEAIKFANQVTKLGYFARIIDKGERPDE